MLHGWMELTNPLNFPELTQGQEEGRSQNSSPDSMGQAGPDGSSISKPLGYGRTPDASLSRENVRFTDVHPGFGDTRGTTVDTIRDTALNSDATLDQFFSRPIKIASVDWIIGSPLYDSFNPWTEYFTNNRVLNRISNYKLMRATLKLKFVINGNAFIYGRAIANWKPLFPSGGDELSLQRDPAIVSNLGLVDIIRASQEPHIYLDPTKSQGGELELPFFTPLNVLDITRGDWTTMGTLVLQSLTNLKHANGATGSISISVFAWAENVKFAIPTQTEAPGITAQSEETGIISKPASTVAKIAGYFTNVPTIGPFATATQIGARAISSMAALFGYSKPPALEHCPFVPTARASIAHTDGVENVARLTLDSKQETTIDPSLAGIMPKDEMTILGVATRESFLTQFDWPIGTAEELLIWNVYVDPGVHGVRPDPNLRDSDEIHLPACAFACMPFQFWKGTLRYRFQVVCSAYHKGRLKLVYDPSSTPMVGLAEYNTAYTTIIDIAEKTDFTLDIGWGQSLPMQSHFSPVERNAQSFWSTLPLPSLSGTTTANGTLSVYVVNELTVPNSDVDNDISINVFISALDDFEVFAPTDADVPFLRVQNTNIPPPALTFQAEEVEDSQVADPPGLGNVANMVSAPNLNKVYFGEAIASFRSLLKRYNVHEYVVYTTGTPGYENATYTRNAFPHQTGPTNETTATSNLIYPSALMETGGLVYGYTTALNYVSLGYSGWRGGIRYLYDFSNACPAEPVNGIPTFSVTRLPYGEGARVQDVVDVTSVTAANVLARELTNIGSSSVGLSGQHVWNSAVNPLQAFEIPWYSPQRFLSPKSYSTFFVGDPVQYQVSSKFYARLNYDGTGFPEILPLVAVSHVAAAEDFTLLFYTGPPIFYRLDSIQ